MKNNLPLALFVLIEILIVAFICLTANALPLNIANHFYGAGFPNGYQSKSAYLYFMIALAAGIPALIVAPLWLNYDPLIRNINIPNKDYWLTEQRKAHTLQKLKNHMIYLGILLYVFIAYIHWLLIKANSMNPAQLPAAEFYLGLSLFIFCTILWGLRLILTFKKISQ
ncbi:MAG: hypothetical protein FJ190_00180 [Gammaproteobacteria bacterium]|nr:hypothetical protein [Gammaproteobacteria bacterium]